MVAQTATPSGRDGHPTSLRHRRDPRPRVRVSARRLPRLRPRRRFAAFSRTGAAPARSSTDHSRPARGRPCTCCEAEECDRAAPRPSGYFTAAIPVQSAPLHARPGGPWGPEPRESMIASEQPWRRVGTMAETVARRDHSRPHACARVGPSLCLSCCAARPVIV